MAQALGLAERAAGRLLYACAALGLVQATGGVFRNTSLTQKYLVEGQPTFIGSYLQMFDALSYHRWEQMGAALRHNGPVDDISHPYRYLADDAEDAATFSAAQHAGSRSLGHALARRVDFTPFTCLLDLGGGSGAYTVAILHRYPHLRAILFDFPQVSRLAEAVMHQEGLTDRVQIVGGDYEHDVLATRLGCGVMVRQFACQQSGELPRVLSRLHALLPSGDGADPRLYARRHSLWPIDSRPVGPASDPRVRARAGV